MKYNKSDLFGRVYFRHSSSNKGLQTYREILIILCELMWKLKESEDFAIFYINQGDSIKYDSVRLSYFVDESMTQKKIELFFKDYQKKHRDIYIDKFEGLMKLDGGKKIVSGYGDEFLEGEFRWFLATSTNIFYELLMCNYSKTKELLIDLRIFYHKRYSYTDKLVAFLNGNAVWEKLEYSLKEKFLIYADYADWMHFPINMVLGCDLSAIERSILHLQAPEKLSRLKISMYEMIEKLSQEV